MSLLDISKVPAKVTIKNISTEDQKIILARPSSIYTLKSNDSLKIVAKDSFELLSYLNQANNKLEIISETISTGTEIENTAIDEIRAALDEKLSINGGEISGDLTVDGVSTFKTKIVTDGLKLTFPVNAVADWDLESTQYSFHRHFVSFSTTIDNIKYQVMLNANIVLTNSFTTMSFLYENFDEICPYIESCVVNYKTAEGIYKTASLISIYQDLTTVDKYATKAVTFKFANIE